MKIKDFIPWMMKRRLLILALFMVIPGASAWTSIAIDYGDTVSIHSLDYKSNGDVCFIYNQTLGLVYQCCGATVTGCYDFAVIEGPTAYKGGAAVLDIDSSGDPHVAYIDTSGLCYWDGAASELLDANVDNLGNIQTDGNNNPHIAYKYGAFPDEDAKELYYSIGSWFTIDYGPDTRLTPLLHLGEYGETVYYVRTQFGGGDTFGSFQVYNHSSDSSTYSQYYNFYSNSHAIRGSDITDFYFREDTEEFFFGYFENIPTTDGIYNATYGNESITRSVTTQARYSFPQSQDVPIYYGYEEGGDYKIGDVGTWTGITEISNLANDNATYRINPIEYEYVLYTHTDGLVYLAYDLPSVIIEGDILDLEDSDPISATICYNSYCDVTNVTGGYSITLPSGTYAANISGAFGYPDYSAPSHTFTEDLENINYYIQADDSTISENLTTINLLFLDYDELEFHPKTGETFQFLYIEGCPGLCGSPFYYTTDSNGRITQNVYIGIYELTSMNHLLFYNEITHKFEGTLSIGIGEEYSDTIFVKEIEESLTVKGNVWGYDQSFSWESRENISGASIIFYNDLYSFNKTSNASGGYEINTLIEGEYDYICGKSGYLSATGKAVYFEDETNIFHFELINGTELGFTISGEVSDQNGTAINGVTVSMYKSDYADSDTTNASGHYNISGLPPGIYKITAMSSGFDQYYYIDEAGDIQFYEVNLIFNNIEYDIILQNQSDINYYCARGNVTDLAGNLLPYIDISIYPKYHWSGAGSFSYKVKKTNSVGYVEICELRDNKEYIMDAYLLNSPYGKETRHFSISGANYTFTLKLPIEKRKFLVLGSVRECDLSIPINARINFKNESGENGSIKYSIFSQDGVFSSDQIENGTYFLDILPDEKAVYGNKTDIELIVMSDLFNADYCLDRFFPFYTWGASVHYKEYNIHTETYLYAGDVAGANIYFTEVNREEAYSCETDDTGYCSKLIPGGEYYIRVISPFYGELTPSPYPEDNPTILSNHRGEIFYYYVKDGSVSPVERERQLSQKEMEATLNIRNTLATYIPIGLIIMLFLFFYSAFRTAFNQ